MSPEPRLVLPVTRLAIGPIVLSGVATTAVHAQWPQWRGPNRDGLVAAAAVPAVWPDKPSVRWTQPDGEVYS